MKPKFTMVTVQENKDSEQLQNKKRYRRPGKVLFSALFLLLLFTGCKQEESYNETTIRVLKKGQIENDIVETFGKDYYNETELRGMLEDEIEKYVEKTGEKDCVSLKELNVGKGIVKASFHYKTGEDYADFNQVTFFEGTIGDALTAGYDLNVNLLSPSAGERIGKEELAGMESSTIVILSEPVLFNPYRSIRYVSANVEYIDETHARVSSDSAGLAYFVLED